MEAAFVILEHEPSRGAGSPNECGPTRADLHWDFMVAMPDRDRMPTWRLSRHPLQAAGDIDAVHIQDHRRAYLDYEGPLSGGRGVVRRVDSGPARVLRFVADELKIELAGACLTGLHEIVRTHAGTLVFRTARP